MAITVTAQASIEERIADRLTEARERTLALVEQLDEEQLNRVYSPILSPLAWDLGHIANFEELWLVQRVGGREPMRGELGRLYDAIESPRRIRNELPILRGDELRGYMAEVRGRALDVLAGIDLASAEDPLLRDGFAYELVIAHEHQHNETMLQLIQMIPGYDPAALDAGPMAAPLAEGGEGAPSVSADGAISPIDGPEMVRVAGGEVEIGAGPDGFAYDNERPLHRLSLEPFWIDRTPVTNGDFAEFIAATGAEPPMYWKREGEGWMHTAFGRAEPIDPALPVIHVDWRQADAFARWAGKRLPSEPEWEAAARGADRARANLDQLAFGPAPAGTFADAPSDCGALQMLGDVWEWTSSEFNGYPGFRAFPYREYSEVFFGDRYRVLRGGSWATRREAIRPTFRNWDLPERRQIFAGFRCARDG